MSKGVFINPYVDQSLPNFDPLVWTNMDILHTIYLPFITRSSVDCLLTLFPPLLVHVVIEGP